MTDAKTAGVPTRRSRVGYARALLRATGLLAAASLASGGQALLAQRAERYTLGGTDVAVYNLAGEMRVERGGGPDVVVEVTRGGKDARELRVDVGRVHGRNALRIRYPDDRVVYKGMGWGSRTTIRVRGDGTFGDGRGGGERVTIAGSGGGLEAHADVRVLVPEGKKLAVYLAVGKANVTDVHADLLVDGGSTSVSTERTRGLLRIDVGSGPVRVNGAEGDLDVDTGSGSVSVNGAAGKQITIDTGSGSVDGSDLSAEALDVDTGSGDVELSNVRADRLRVDTGSGGIDIAAARTTDVKLDTGSGSVRLDLLTDVEAVLIDTGSGSVTLRVPPELGAQIRVDTGSGGINAAVSMYVIERRRSFLTGRIGDGNGRIEIETGSGSVRLTGPQG
ncbi:MAG: DUF4097 family beta strand repeat protein [Gemmatimonadetes bacterium]|nr:DUF4097 family beta strand repeat protein [Gemmatimonadota bacterium]